MATPTDVKKSMAFTPRKKSGDSARQDAAKAVQKAFVSEEAPNPENLAQKLQGAVEEAKERGDDPDRIAQIEEGMQLLMKTLSNLNAKIISMEEAAAQNKPGVMQGPPPRLECGQCRQMIKLKDGRGVCDGEHEIAFVAPTDYDLYRIFPGVTINGVPYVGRCILPKSMVGQARAMVSQWQHGQKRLQTRGGRINSPHELKGMAMGSTPVLA